MKIALVQLNYRVGDFARNVERITASVLQARDRGADLAVFAELSVCGYPPRDFLEFDDFIVRCEAAVDQIAKVCTGIAAIVGAPSRNPAPRGKPLYNSAWFLSDGKVVEKVHKTLLPNYDVFDEYRYFEPNRQPYRLVEYKGLKIALTICEDLWNLADDPLYIRNPADDLAALGPDLMINIAASPFHYDQPVLRREILSRNASRYGFPVVYVNQVGAQTELIFDGDSMVAEPGGSFSLSLKQFSEDTALYEFKPGTRHVNADAQPNRPGTQMTELPAVKLIRSALVLGIHDYFEKMGFTRAILGLSGGIDSAVTLVLAAEALGAENVHAVLLPSQFSSEHSVADARDLAVRLGVPYEIISIRETCAAVEKTLKPNFHGLPSDVTEENIQARARALILMALSNKFGYVLLNTSNKSEAAVGYGTLYGDMCGGLSVLGDVYKTMVYELAGLINQQDEIIPMNTILKPPSAELRPDQKDSDSLPDYDLLDRILYAYIEKRMGPKELVAAGFGESTVNRVLKLVNTSEYKRHQTPPILRVSPKAFGMGRRLPIVGKYLS